MSLTTLSRSIGTLVAGGTVLAASVLSAPAALAIPDADTPLVFSPGLQACINGNLSRTAGVDITEWDLEMLLGGTVRCDSRYDLSDGLTGVEHLTGVYSLTFSESRITDLGPLANAPHLTILQLDRAGTFTSIEPLRTLTAMDTLVLRGHQLEDLSVVQNMPDLVELTLEDAGTTSLEGLTGHPALQILELSDSQIDDVAPITDLPDLFHLVLDHAGPFTSIEPLRSLDLVTLKVHGSPLDDLSPIAGMTNLRRLELVDVGATDIGALTGLTSLKNLDLSHNHIADLSPLGPDVIDELTSVDVSANHIADLGMFGTRPQQVARAEDQEVRPGVLYVPADADGYRVETLDLPRSWAGAGTDAVSAGTDTTDTANGSIHDGTVTWPLSSSSNAPQTGWVSFADPDATASYNGYIEYDLTPVALADTTLADGRVGEEYTFAFELTEAEAPYDAFTLVGDVPGLSLASDGTLRGTPTEAGTHSVVVEARDAWGNVVSGSYSLRIDEPMEPTPTPTPVEPTPAEPTPTPAEPGDGDGDGNGGDGSGDGSSGSGNGSSSGSTDGTGSATGAGTGDRLAGTGAEQNGLWLAATGAIA
ncbi:MAG: hypothetical protein J0H73_16930, partial [Salana multivorans]|nr:hypothetical protein [Salana multivorans]